MRINLRIMLLSIIAVLLYGIVIELHQIKIALQVIASPIESEVSE